MSIFRNDFNREDRIMVIKGGLHAYLNGDRGNMSLIYTILTNVNRWRKEKQNYQYAQNYADFVMFINNIEWEEHRC